MPAQIVDYLLIWSAGTFYIRALCTMPITMKCSLVLAIFLFINCDGRSQISDNVALRDFWETLKLELTNHDSIAVSRLVHFPLANAQILIGRNQEGLTKDEFLNNFDKVFTSELTNEILTSDVSSLVSNNAKPDEYVFQKTFYPYDREKKYSIAFFINKVNNKYRLTRFEFAG